MNSREPINHPNREPKSCQGEAFQEPGKTCKEKHETLFACDVHHASVQATCTRVHVSSTPVNRQNRRGASGRRSVTAIYHRRTHGRNREGQTRRKDGGRSQRSQKKKKRGERERVCKAAWPTARMECVINASAVAPRRIKSLWQAFIVIIRVFAASYILTVVNGLAREPSQRLFARRL